MERRERKREDKEGEWVRGKEKRDGMMERGDIERVDRRWGIEGERM